MTTTRSTESECCNIKVTFALPFWIMDDEFCRSRQSRHLEWTDGNVIEDALFELGACQVCLNHQVWAEFEVPSDPDVKDVGDWIQGMKRKIDQILEAYANRSHASAS